MINIRGIKSNIDNDMFYRYKMHCPKLIEHKNTKIFDNLNEICKDLNRDKKIILKFLKNKLNVNIIDKNDKILLPKTISTDQILNNIYEYIEKYVLCPNCKLPETILQENQIQCKCCSYSGKIV